MNELANEGAIIIWQKAADDTPQQALLVEAYADVIQIAQEGTRIDINYETVKELCAVLKSIKRPS
jgi:hypothetical protein